MRNLKSIFVICVIFLVFGCKENQEQKKNYTIPAANQVSNSEFIESMERGKSLYYNYCAACHLTSGKGIANAFPPLDGSDWLSEKRRESISAVKNGLKGEIEVNGETYNSVMLDLGLNDQEVVDVLNYIMNSWSNKIQPQVTLEEVQQLKK